MITSEGSSAGQSSTRASKRARLASAMRASGVSSVLAHAPAWNGTVVLSYHRIGFAASSELHRGLFSATPERLDEHLRFVQKHFELVEPAQLDEALPRRRGRRILVTFDDGYRDLYELAAPVLRANDVRALMFICSGFVDGDATAWWDEIAWMLRHAQVATLGPGPWSPKPVPLAAGTLDGLIDAIVRRYWQMDGDQGVQLLEALAVATGAGRRPRAPEDWITWEMARQLVGEGHGIGGHTHTHPLLAREPAHRQRTELTTSLGRLQTEIGERPTAFAYPVGIHDAFNTDSRAALRAEGVRWAFSNYGGMARGPALDELDVPRVAAESLRPLELYKATLLLPQVLMRVA